MLIGCGLVWRQVTCGHQERINTLTRITASIRRSVFYVGMCGVEDQRELECGPMPNLTVALPIIGGASIQRRKVWLKPTTRCRAVTLPTRETR